LPKPLKKSHPSAFISYPLTVHACHSQENTLATRFSSYIRECQSSVLPSFSPIKADASKTGRLLVHLRYHLDYCEIPVLHPKSIMQYACTVHMHSI